MRNNCQITFEGLNVNRLLCVLNAQNIPLYGVSRQGKKCTVEVPASRSKQTIAILQERCYNIIGIEFFGAAKMAKFAKKHFVLPLICLVLVAVLAISSQFCLRIEVTGDFEKSSVCAALEAVGVNIGADLHKLNLNAVQNSLANELDAMYAVVTRSGSVLYVNAVARKEIDPPIDLNKKRDIVATRSGTVTNIVCEQGTPLVQVGDKVNVGDVLIEGKRTFNDGTGKDIYALGRITLSVCAKGFAAFDGTKAQVVETGNVFRCTGVILFGKQYSKPCPFEQFTVDTTVTRLFPLNLAICNNVYRETVTTRVAATIDECLSQLQEQAYADALNNCDFTVTDTVYETTSDGVYARCYGQIYIE